MFGQTDARRRFLRNCETLFAGVADNIGPADEILCDVNALESDLFDVVELRTLLAVIDAGGITAAARTLHLSPSALSDRIKAMEDRAGFALFTRTTRGSLPTSAGAQLAREARKMIVQSEQISGLIHSWRARAQGEIVLQANSNAICSFIPDALASFLRTYPDVRVQLREELSEDIASNVRSGEADIGIAANNVDLSGLAVHSFRTDKLVLLVSRSHPLANLREIDFLQAADEAFVGLDHNAAIQTYVLQQAAILGRSLVMRATLRAFDGVIKLVVAGAGVAVIPASVIPKSIPLAGARVVELRDQWATRELIICTQENVALPRLTGLLLESLLKTGDSLSASTASDDPSDPGR